jgi:hypothetical protein
LTYVKLGIYIIGFLVMYLRKGTGKYKFLTERVDLF